MTAPSKGESGCSGVELSGWSTIRTKVESSYREKGKSASRALRGQQGN